MNELNSLLLFIVQNEKTKRKPGIKRSFSLLSDMKSYVYVDYDMSNSITGQFSIYENDIDNI